MFPAMVPSERSPAAGHWTKGDQRPFVQREKNMKRVFIAAMAAGAVLAGGQALAQTVGVAPAETVVIAPEQRMIIKQYVVQERVNPVIMQERIAVGSVLPADVELRSVPTTWGPAISPYRYVYTNDNVVLVEPGSRRVIQVID